MGAEEWPAPALSRAEAARLRDRLGSSDPCAMARLLGVQVRRLPPRCQADVDAGIRAEYLADPPTIFIYGRDSALAVAHELFHHCQQAGLLAPELRGLDARESELCARAFAESLIGREEAGDHR